METHERYLLPEDDSVLPAAVFTDTLHQTSVSHQRCCHDNRNRKAGTTPVQTREVYPAGAAMLLTEVCVCVSSRPSYYSCVCVCVCMCVF